MWDVPSAWPAVGEPQLVSCSIPSRLIVGVVGMRCSDASGNLSRSGLRRDRGLVARHLVYVFIIFSEVHVLMSSDRWERGALYLRDILEGKL